MTGGGARPRPWTSGDTMRYAEWATARDRWMAGARAAGLWLVLSASGLGVLVAIDAVGLAVGWTTEVIPRWAAIIGVAGAVLRLYTIIDLWRARRQLLASSFTSLPDPAQRRWRIRGSWIGHGVLFGLYATSIVRWWVCWALWTALMTIGSVSMYFILLAVRGKKNHDRDQPREPAAA